MLKKNNFKSLFNLEHIWFDLILKANQYVKMCIITFVSLSIKQVSHI